MNFKEYLDWYSKEPFDYPPTVKDGWYACKREIIKILNKHIQPICDTQTQKDAELFIHLDAIEEIKKI